MGRTPQPLTGAPQHPVPEHGRQGVRRTYDEPAPPRLPVVVAVAPSAGRRRVNGWLLVGLGCLVALIVLSIGPWSNDTVTSPPRHARPTTPLVVPTSWPDLGPVAPHAPAGEPSSVARP